MIGVLDSGVDVGRVIQLAVAPVFLLVAVGSLLNVVTARLGRVIDRARALEREIVACENESNHRMYRDELRGLDSRMSYNHRSINLLSSSGLVIAFLVAALFLSDLWGVDASVLISVLFIVAMSMIVAGIGFFLGEVHIATRTVRVRSELIREEQDRP